MHPCLLYSYGNDDLGDEVGVNQRRFREVSEKVLQGQDTKLKLKLIGYGSGSNLDRVPWVVSTVSCP